EARLFEMFEYVYVKGENPKDMATIVNYVRHTTHCSFKLHNDIDYRNIQLELLHCHDNHSQDKRKEGEYNKSAKFDYNKAAQTNYSQSFSRHAPIPAINYDTSSMAFPSTSAINYNSAMVNQTMPSMSSMSA